MDENNTPSADEMVRRAITNALSAHRALVRDGVNAPVPTWQVVKELLGYGSTTSAAICREYGLDPDEYVDTAEGKRCG